MLAEDIPIAFWIDIEVIFWLIKANKLLDIPIPAIKMVLIDIRDKNELQKLGTIENSFHIPRGLLEFSIHPESPYVQNNQIDLSKELVLFCAAGGRSALAAKTLKDMGFKNVSHIEGGFGLMTEKGFKIKS